MHVLYIEDDEGLLYLLGKSLEDAGFSFTGASNGEQGLKLLQERQFDAVVIDQEMPYMTGLEVIQRAKELDHKSPIIMVTGAGNEEVAVQAMRMGASDYLVKDSNLVYLHILPSVIRQVIHERELVEARQAAEQQLQLERDRSRLLSEFIRDASHEFRTPLTIIKTSLHLLSSFCDQPKQLRYVTQVQEQTDSISGLVNRLLRLARLDNATTVDAQPVPLKSMIREIVELKRSVIEENNIKIDLDLPAETVNIPGDEDELVDTFTELLDNALRFSEPGSRIEIELCMAPMTATITIRDVGIGMSDEELSHIFERFYRVDDAHSTPGFGLGLPIAARVIELHHGDIHVESAPGKGTTVTVILPVNGKA